MAEDAEGAAARVRRVCVYCGSKAGADPRYTEAAAELGQEIARRGLGLVYGGGTMGLMGVVARAVRGSAHSSRAASRHAILCCTRGSLEFTVTYGP